MEKIIETVDNFRITAEKCFNFGSGATEILYRVQELKENKKIQNRWYGWRTVYVLEWEYITGPYGWYIPHIFKSKAIAYKYIKYRIKCDKNTDDTGGSVQKSN